VLRAAGRNFVRGVILGLMATFSGILLFSFHEYVQQIFGITLPISPALIVSVLVARQGCLSRHRAPHSMGGLLALGGAWEVHGSSATCVSAPGAQCPTWLLPCFHAQVSLKVAGSAIFNWIMTAFYF
jgi:hypothetical protein